MALLLVNLPWALTLSLATAGAEETPAYTLGEIVVTGAKPRVVEQVTTVDEVTADEIRRRGARNLEEAINLLPGLYVRNGADGVPRIDVRGMRTRNVLLFLDGVPLNNAYDGQFDPAAIPVENIARIKMTRGSSSVLYGPGGNAGVINIITRGAGDTLDGSILGEHSFEDSEDVRGYVSGTAGDVGMVFSGSWYDRDHYELSDDYDSTDLQDDGDRINSDLKEKTAFGSFTFDPTEAFNAGFNVNYADGKYGKPPITVSNQDSDYANRARYERVDYDQWAAHGAVAWELSDAFTLRPSVFYNKLHEKTKGFDDDSFSSQDASGSFTEDADTHITGGGLQLAWQFRDWGLATVAFNGRKEDWDSDGFTVESSGGGGGGGGGGGTAAAPVPFDQDESYHIYSAGLEFEYSSASPFSGVTGVGWNRQDRNDADDDDDYTFIVGAAYQFRPLTRLRASVSRQIRFPTLRDLYAIDRGNPDLKPERTNNYEVALEQGFAEGDVMAEVVLFRIDAKDFIERVPGGLAENFEKYRFEGVEFTTSYRPIDTLKFGAGYTYLHSENRNPPADPNEYGTDKLQNRPKHKYTVTGDYDAPFGMTVRVEFLRVTDTYALSRSTPTTALKLDDYSVVNAKISQTFWKDRMRIFGRVENASDENYEESFGFPQPGRTWFVGVDFRL